MNWKEQLKPFVNSESLDDHVLYALGGIVALLLLATIIGGLLKFAAAPKLANEVWTRTMTWWVMAGLFIIAIILPIKFSLIFFALLSFLALKEYFSLIPTRRADRRALFWAYLAIPVQFYIIYTGWYGMFVLFIPVYIFLLIPIRLVLIGETQGFLRAAGQIHWGLMITVYSLSYSAAFLTLEQSDRTLRLIAEKIPNDHTGNPLHGGNIALLIYLVFLTQFNDVAQFCWGKSLSALWGGHKIAPSVSPNKTWEGLLGGVATTITLAWLLGKLLTPMNWLESLLAGAIISLSGFFGDLTIAAIKRDLGVKDAGSLLPGHGGVLDRINSLTFASPLFFHFIRYLHY